MSKTYFLKKKKLLQYTTIFNKTRSFKKKMLGYDCLKLVSLRKETETVKNLYNMSKNYIFKKKLHI